jgi:protocatechuate 3,4-dioxygenase beta subunit
MTTSFQRATRSLLLVAFLLGLMPALSPAQPASAQVEASAASEAIVTVTFLDADGSPVTDGYVYANETDCCGYFETYGASPYELALPDGTWEIVGNDYDTGHETEPTTVTVTGGVADQPTITIQLPPQNVTVTFIDADGNPITNGYVSANSADCCSSRTYYGASPYELALPDGTWDIYGYDYDTGQQTDPTTVTVTDGVANQPTITIQLPPINLIVTFLDADGNPIADGEVYANETDCCGYRSTGGASPYELALPDGTWEIAGYDYDTGHRTGTTTVTVTGGVADQPSITIQLPPVNVTVTFIDADGAPITNGYVSANKADWGGYASADGASPYELALPDGTWDIYGYDYDTGRQTETTTVTVTGGVADQPTITIQLAPTNLTVTFLDAYGNPIYNGLVYAEESGCCGSRSTGGDSPYELALPDGTWDIYGRDWDTGRQT